MHSLAVQLYFCRNVAIVIESRTLASGWLYGLEGSIDPISLSICNHAQCNFKLLNVIDARYYEHYVKLGKDRCGAGILTMVGDAHNRAIQYLDYMASWPHNIWTKWH